MMLIHDNPRIAQSAPSRIYNMIIEKGTEEINEYENLIKSVKF